MNFRRDNTLSIWMVIRRPGPIFPLWKRKNLLIRYPSPILYDNFIIYAYPFSILRRATLSYVAGTCQRYGGKKF